MKLEELILLSCSALSFVTLPTRPLQAQSTSPEQANADTVVIQDFENGVDEYVKLRKQVKLPRLKTTNSAPAIADHERECARKIRAARQTAKQGDIFTPQICAEFRRLIGAGVQGLEATRVRQSLRHAEPVSLRLRINALYPASVPLQSSPPTLLQNLPKLPPEVDYRVVGHDLVLRDVEANLIVDFMRNAIP
jgi:hypothetical protein